MRLGSSLRTRLPAVTTAIAERLMPTLGIRAVFDATGLDRLGLPVFFSVRSSDNSLRIHSGKGLTAADARVGALMEALELAVAERASLRASPLRVTIGELDAQLPSSLTFADFAPRLGADRHPSRRIPAIRCPDIATGETALVPAELVLVPFALPGTQRLFGWSSSGLASGNSRDEASLHALLEVLERDTLAMNLAADVSSLVVDEELPELFRHKTREWRRLGVELFVRHVPNAFGLPCFEAALHDASSRAVPLARGSGLHLDKEIALARAVCEAAQSRARALYGRRPGSPPDGPAKRLRSRAALARELSVLERLRNPARQIGFDAIPERRCRSVGAALGELVRRLEAAGFPRVYRHEMEADGAAAARQLHVVRVVVPRSESAVGRDVRMGPRLLARVLQPRR